MDLDRFAIPFTFATTLGLAAVALRGDPSMRALSAADVSAGLPAAAAAAALLGKSGAAALLVLLFLAVTSACSAELIAVSSIVTYDVYKVGVWAILCGLVYPCSIDRHTLIPKPPKIKFYA